MLCGKMAMTSFVGQLVSPLSEVHKAWEDPSIIKWRKRDAHVTLRCHDTVEGDDPFCVFYIFFYCVPAS